MRPIHEHVRRVIALRESMLRLWGKRIAILFGFAAIGAIFLSLCYAFLFGPPGISEKRPEFIVSPEDTLLSVSERLEEEGLVKHAGAARFAYSLLRNDRTVRPGGYVLSPGMDALAVAKTLGQAPYLTWVVIPEARRKEEVGEMLAETLNWSTEERAEWAAATAPLSDGLSEGVYYADIYLIPSDQPPSAVAARLRDRFNEALLPYTVEAFEKGVAIEEVITLASIVERESAKNDKRLVAGILTNRLNRGMLLQVDATLQYLAGEEGNWWKAPDVDDKDTDSPYNTYKYEGLPPGPIATPSLASIEAVLNPQKTSCLYYLHDAYGRIHCAATYQAHVANVNRYLR
jgi:UPF0755 protein